MYMQITCARFSPFLDLNKYKDKSMIVRVYSKKLKHSINYLPLATDGLLLYIAGKRYKLADAPISHKTILVLTNKEAGHLLEFAHKNKLELLVFENLFPFFKNIKYVNLAYNYNKLINNIRLIKKQNIDICQFSTLISNDYLYKVERKLRTKSTLDQAFSQLPLTGYKEVFKLKEAREDRSIICLDFNSMFPSLLNEEYYDPKHLQYKEIKQNYSELKQLEKGLFHVVLKKCNSDFFKNYNYFEYADASDKNKFQIDADIETLLYADELEILSGYFEEIFVIDAIISSKQMAHPLAKEVGKLYKQRLKYKKEQNEILENMVKYQMTLLHSCTNQRKHKKIYIKNSADITSILSKVFNLPINTHERYLKYFLKKGILQIDKDNKGRYLSYLDLSSPFNIFSLSAHVLTKAKIKVLKMLERVLDFPDAEICYINIDSLHISIKTADLPHFLEKNKAFISDKLGDLKIEAIADKGYWLDVGRYWLFSEGKLIKHRNILFNSHFINNPYRRYRTVKRVLKFRKLLYIQDITIQLISTLKMNKIIKNHGDHINNKRPNASLLVESSKYNLNMLNMYEKNQSTYHELINEIFNHRLHN